MKPRHVKKAIDARERAVRADECEQVLLAAGDALRARAKTEEARERRRRARGSGIYFGDPVTLLEYMASQDGITNHYEAKRALRWTPEKWKKNIAVLDRAGLVYKPNARGGGSWHMTDAGWDLFE